MSNSSSKRNGTRESRIEPRAVEAGDTLEHLTREEAEHDAVDRGALRSQTGNHLTLRDMISRHAKGEPGGEVISHLRVLLEGAAPDERKALKKLLWAPTESERADDHHLDLELSRRWRDGGYPYKNLMSRKGS